MVTTMKNQNGAYMSKDIFFKQHKMRETLTGIVIFILLTPTIVCADTAERKAQVISEAELRTQPDLNAEILRRIPPSERVYDVLNRQGMWVNISVGGQPGWVYGAYLKIKTIKVDTQKTAPPEKTAQKARPLPEKVPIEAADKEADSSANVSTASMQDDLSAREIMKKANSISEGDNSISQMDMILFDKFGNQRSREMVTYGKKIDDDRYSVTFFLHPSDVKGAGFLSIKFDDSEKEDDQWLYLPSMKRTRRIVSKNGGRTESFMGSDFTYADLSSVNMNNYDYKFHEKQKEVKVKGYKCWLIWSIPRNRDVIESTGYTKSLLYIRQDNYFIYRAKFYIEKGGYIKYLNVKELDKIDGIWIATEVHMSKKSGTKTVHKTILTRKNVQFDQDLEDNLFDVQRLEKQDHLLLLTR